MELLVFEYSFTIKIKNSYAYMLQRIKIKNISEPKNYVTMKKHNELDYKWELKVFWGLNIFGLLIIVFYALLNFRDTLNK